MGSGRSGLRESCFQLLLPLLLLLLLLLALEVSKYGRYGLRLTGISVCQGGKTVRCLESSRSPRSAAIKLSWVPAGMNRL